ncbi:hypothetical protein AVEN_205912-1 [Araneus ventricosus]|uniref:Uncharacterized protein n=1 Tax=Araneus ventricosus TaxID=182803 RepID=A0A4Y2KVV8_ARAVE|nr:hypothetical protein AVEN_205912-1 [Araneus ventricosus]
MKIWYVVLTSLLRPRWPSEEVQVLGPDSTKDPSCLGPAASSYVGVKRLPVGMVRKLGEGVTGEVPSSSSDRGSKRRGPAQNSPRVAPKRDFNMSKLDITTVDQY